MYIKEILIKPATIKIEDIKGNGSRNNVIRAAECKSHIGGCCSGATDIIQLFSQLS